MTQLEIEYDLCKKNFFFFLCFCFKLVYGSQFTLYKFHKNLCNILLNIRDTKRCIINAPPRTGKTEIVKHYVAWLIFRNPHATIMYVSYSQNLANKKSREIRDLLQLLSKRFNIPELRLQKSSDAKSEWTNLAEGGVIARGSGNDITGNGCNTMLILDDPNKPSDRRSQAKLDERNSLFAGTVRNRINSADVPILIMQQRVASDDVTGFVLKGGMNEKYTHFCFPAINDDGTALCPERLPLSEIEAYKSDPFTYNAQYLQKPLENVNKIFLRNSLQMCDPVRIPKDRMRWIISVDPASKGGIENDFNAIALVGFCDGKYFVMDVENFHSDITELLRRCRAMRDRWGANIPILFEARANGQAAVQLLRRETNGILETHPCKDKIERAVMTKYLFDAGNVYFGVRGIVWASLIAQFTEFPKVAHDDIVDAVVQGITYLMQLPAPRNNKENQDIGLRRPMRGVDNECDGYNPVRTR